MKLTSIKIILITTCLFIVNSAYAYKFIIYTDQVPATSAQKVSNVIKTTYPFSKFDIEVEIVTLSPNELKCGSKGKVDRLLVCSNSKKLQRSTIKAGGDQAIIIVNSSEVGGSADIGGGVPVITSNMPDMTIIHEYLHTLGLGDEYEYANNETKNYCKKYKKVLNYVFIDPLDPYASDTMAKSIHMGEIPWFKDIIASTPITNSNGTRLGTQNSFVSYIYPINVTNKPTNSSELIGLYKGTTCKNATPPMATWQPGPDITVMGNRKAGLGPALEKIVEKIMISKGAKLKHIASVNINIIDGNTNIQINNSSMFKSIDKVNSVESYKPRAVSPK